MASKSTHDNSVDISNMDGVIVLAWAAIAGLLLFVVGPAISIG